MKPISEDGFDFLFFHSIDKVRRWPGKVGAVSRGLMIWG